MKCITVTLLCFSLVSLAIVFSITDMKRLMKEGEKEELKTGNTLYMIISVVLIIVTLSLELFPIYIYFLEESEKVVFITKTWLIIGGIATALIVLNVCITGISIALGIKKFNSLELV